MFAIKQKKCRACKKDFTPFKSTDKFCSHQCFYSIKKPAKDRPKIRVFSTKRQAELREYRKVRDEYMRDHKQCEVDGCNKRSTNIHHKAGRIGNLLTDVNYFMACCSECHPKKIHENPSWAREKGYLI